MPIAHSLLLFTVVPSCSEQSAREPLVILLLHDNGVHIRVACRRRDTRRQSGRPGNNEIRPGVSGRFSRPARYPLDPPAIAQFLGRGNWLISKVRVSSLDRARHAMDLVAAPVDTPGLVEHTVFGEDLVNGRAPAHGVVFTKDVVKIAGQQGRYVVGHSFAPPRIEAG